MSTIQALLQIYLQEKLHVFLVSEYKQNTCLILKILDIENNKAFIGQTSDLDLRTQAARIRLTFSDYLNEMKIALFHSKPNNSTYVYSLQQESESYVFKWKSVDQEETVINLGIIQMQVKPYVSLFSEVLMSLSKEIQQLNETISNYADKFKVCKDQTDFALDQLTKTNDLKDKLEKEMFSKFLLVLNEKKKNFEVEKRSNNCQKYVISKNSPQKKTKLNAISDSSDEEEFLGLNKPSTSKLFKNDSIIFFSDEDDSVVPVKPSKKRNRKAPQQNKSMEEQEKIIESKLIDENDGSDDSLFNNL